MRKNHRIFTEWILLATMISAMISLSASAHSGKTDSDGGHTDSSTGEYHYHHGYQAHDHYDMNGDGIVDCPYNFDDKTGENSGNHSSVDSDAPNDSVRIDDSLDHIEDIESSDEAASNNLETETSKTTVVNVLKAMLVCLLPAISIGVMAAYFLSYLFLLIFGKDKGCLPTFICFAIISLVAYILLIVDNLK